MNRYDIHLPPAAIAAVLSFIVLTFYWAFAAAQFAHEKQGWRTEGVAGDDGNPFSHSRSMQSRLRREAADAFIDFTANAVWQLPHAVAVLRYNVEHRVWLIAIFIVLEAGVLSIAWWMRSLERQWSSRPQRRKS